MHRDWLDDREPPSDIECPSSSDDNDANENNPTDHVNIEEILHTGTGTDLLWHITHSTTNYWENIVRMMITGKLGVKMSATMKQLMERVYNLLGETFFNSLGWEDLWPEFDWQKRRVNQIPNLNTLVSKLGDEMDTAFSLQVVGKVELLKVLSAQTSHCSEEAQTRKAFMKIKEKGLLLHHLFKIDRRFLRKSHFVSETSNTRFVRTPSFSTNGVVLSILYIDLTSAQPPKNPKAQDAINLPNIQTQMHIRNTHPNAHIIGIDLGVECMFAAVAYNPDDPAHLQTLVQSRTSDSQ
ncbi:hypothetical protein SeLEV6574_g03185 [Synchytrium endobioticum]|uniref:Uncharacterized protein n=1 Tax=Synchytrium endobioticum TaxID=286115 RepID=A0A507D5G1_9FUNG|nr:hypothetical protein SeLEV6574_g03185 [Synchytrium endobioticum]